jgi:bacterial leucyl aminopeptidase
MLFGTALVALATSLQFTSAAPAAEAASGDSELRLVKTSEEDPGQWVTEAQKFELFTSKNIGFIDITDIKVGHAALTELRINAN